MYLGVDYLDYSIVKSIEIRENRIRITKSLGKLKIIIHAYPTPVKKS